MNQQLISIARHATMQNALKCLARTTSTVLILGSLTGCGPAAFSASNSTIGDSSPIAAFSASNSMLGGTPCLTSDEAISYTKLPDGSSKINDRKTNTFDQGCINQITKLDTSHSISQFFKSIGGGIEILAGAVGINLVK